jgi:hypothetical protein
MKLTSPVRRPIDGRELMLREIAHAEYEDARASARRIRILARHLCVISRRMRQTARAGARRTDGS